MSSRDTKLDDAARAAWLAYIGGMKQDEIASVMGLSRQSVQRLVSQAVAGGLVKTRIDHPISQCMDLARDLKARYGLQICEVVPQLASDAATGTAVSHATGHLIERWLSKPDPLILGIGTGRTLRGAVDHLPHLDCARHKIISLTGNISPDGSTALYNVLFTMAEKVTAPTFPMPVPVISASAGERAALLGQKTLATHHDLSLHTDIRFVGIGAIEGDAPLVLDGFITREDQTRLLGKGAVGEIIGYVFDAGGQLIDDDINTRVSSAPLPASPVYPTIAAAHGHRKRPAIRAALDGKLINGLITDEATAAALLG